MSQAKCFICDSNVELTSDGAGPVRCPVCGPYRVSGTVRAAGVTAAGIPASERYLISAWVREKYRAGQAPPLVTTDLVTQIVQAAPTYSPDEKMQRLLLVIGNLLKRPGVQFEIPDLSYADAWAHDAGEMKSYLNWMDGDGFTEKPGGGSARRLTRKGWHEFDRLSRAHSVTSRRGFVAMWFSPEMDSAWNEGFRAAIADAGFDPYRIKEDIHDERIDARIVVAIRESRFVVADVTGARPAVYYEAGFADGIRKPLIWTCRKGNSADMSFDTRQYLHILWDDPLDLRRQLVPVIQARMTNP